MLAVKADDLLYSLGGIWKRLSEKKYKFVIIFEMDISEQIFLINYFYRWPFLFDSTHSNTMQILCPYSVTIRIDRE